MATPPVIDFAELLAPIPGENPAGNRAFTSLLANRVNYLRDGFDPDSPPPPDKRGNKGEPMWKNIENEAKAALAKKCKDFEIAGWLTEALLMRYGFAGARDGFRLIRELWETAWDRVYPALDPEEPADSIEKRIGRITTLASDGKPFFVIKLRKATLIESGNEAYSLQSIDDGKGNALVSAHASADPIAIAAVREDIQQCKDEVTKLEAAIVAKAPDAKMALMSIANVLDESLRAVPAPDSAQQPQIGPGGATTPGGGVAQLPSKPSRGQIYAQIAKLANDLEELEKHSPIPMILRKIELLKDMKFHELVEVMTAKDNPLEFVTPPEPKKD